jgi:hypothetical protein
VTKPTQLVSCLYFYPVDTNLFHIQVFQREDYGHSNTSNISEYHTVQEKSSFVTNNILQEIDTYLCIQLKFDKIPRDNESNYIFHKRIASYKDEIYVFLLTTEPISENF